MCILSVFLEQHQSSRTLIIWLPNSFFLHWRTRTRVLKLFTGHPFNCEMNFTDPIKTNLKNKQTKKTESVSTIQISASLRYDRISVNEMAIQYLTISVRIGTDVIFNAQYLTNFVQNLAWSDRSFFGSSIFNAWSIINYNNWCMMITFKVHAFMDFHPNHLILTPLIIADMKRF